MNDLQRSPKPWPAPEKEQAPQEEPVPEAPKRRHHFTTPVFSTRAQNQFSRPRKLIVTLLVAASTVFVHAQNNHVPPPPTMDPQQPGSPTPDDPSRGWVLFNDAVARSLQLKDEQLIKLRQMDARYEKEYDAMGTSPTSDPGYPALTDKRKADVEGILTPEQYAQWQKQYGNSTHALNEDHAPTKTK